MILVTDWAICYLVKYLTIAEIKKIGYLCTSTNIYISIYNDKYLEIINDHNKTNLCKNAFINNDNETINIIYKYSNFYGLEIAKLATEFGIYFPKYLENKYKTEYYQYLLRTNKLEKLNLKNIIHMSKYDKIKIIDYIIKYDHLKLLNKNIKYLATNKMIIIKAAKYGRLDIIKEILHERYMIHMYLLESCYEFEQSIIECTPENDLDFLIIKYLDLLSDNNYYFSSFFYECCLTKGLKHNKNNLIDYSMPHIINPTKLIGCYINSGSPIIYAQTIANNNNILLNYIDITKNVLKNMDGNYELLYELIKIIEKDSINIYDTLVYTDLFIAVYDNPKNTIELPEPNIAQINDIMIKLAKKGNTYLFDYMMKKFNNIITKDIVDNIYITAKYYNKYDIIEYIKHIEHKTY